MSNLLGFESFLIPLGATVEDVKSTLGTALTSKGWQIVGRTIALQATVGNMSSAANAFDNGYYATPVAITAPALIGVQLQTARIITKYRISSVPNVSTNTGPKNWTLEYSDNGSSWTVADTRTNEPSWTVVGGETREYAVGGSPGAHLYWRLNITAPQYSTSVNLGKIRFYTDTANEFVSTKSSIYVVPPVTETIGDANAREVVLISFTGTTIIVQPCLEALQDVPQTIALYQKTAGAVACGLNMPTGAPFDITASLSGVTLTVTASAGVLSVGSPITGVAVKSGTYITALGTGTGGAGTYTINNSDTFASTTFKAQAVSVVTGATGAPGATAQDNLRALYVALKNSADAAFTDWDWFYTKPAPQNANDTNDYLYGVRKTAAPNIYPSPNANANIYYPGNYHKAGFANLDNIPGGVTGAPGQTLTCDLINGFIYYFQINSRGFALATKTNANYFGPIHACYGDHAKAIAAMPTTQHPRGLTPSELLVGFDGTSANITSTATPAKFMGLSSSQNTAPSYAFDNSSYSGSNPFSGYRTRDQFTDLSNSFGQYTPWYINTLQVPMVASGVFSNAAEPSSADDFQIHRMVMNGNWQGTTPLASPTVTADAAMVVPMLDIQDWYRFRGTASNEALALVADTVAATTLAQVMDNTTAYTSLNLTDASTLATAGFVIIENEVIQYTGKSGNTLTGVTRAKYGTAMQNHWTGDSTYQGLWFCIINGGALFCGFVKPS